jgi:hypothetical protein
MVDDTDPDMGGFKLIKRVAAKLRDAPTYYGANAFPETETKSLGS